MARVVLIHGTSVGVKYSVFRDRCFIDGSFKYFRPLLSSGEAVLFNWHQAEHEVDFFSSLNPFSVVNVYKQERDYLHTEVAQRKLSQFLYEKQPEIVIAHSLGCNYLMQTVNFAGLPKSVNKVVTIASEALSDLKITDTEIAHRIMVKEMEWLNYYCFWDSVIIFSWLITGKLASGVFGSQDSLINNRFYPQSFAGDPHTSMLRDSRIWKKLLI